MNTNKFLQIHPADNVAVCICAGASKGETAVVGGLSIPVVSDIPAGHKLALRNIAAGEPVIKYGFPIGIASSDIKAGEWVHSHNLRSGLNENLDYSYSGGRDKTPVKPDGPTVDGYLRSNGKMGIRNELWVIPSVGCVNAQAKEIARRLKEEAHTDAIDDVVALTHNYGCSQLGVDHENTRKALAALIRHPNAGGVIVIGLGCENNQIAALKEEVGEHDASRVKWIVAQEVENEIETGVAYGRQLLGIMATDSRQPLPVSMLTVGLKCGGSDGLSGITANPLVGLFSDWLTSHGGSTVLTEVPEMFGAETILMERAENVDVFNRTVSLINDFKDYFRLAGLPIYENPSPGNKAGGITTLEEKSLGCVQKGGSSTVVDVLRYADSVKEHGLSLLCAPGNDLVASTTLALAGCQLILFTTGRGTPFGTVVPTLKIATNTGLAERKPAWIDFNAGTLLSADPQCVCRSLIELVLATASGQPSRNECANAKEIAIFKSGVTL